MSDRAEGHRAAYAIVRRSLESHEHGSLSTEVFTAIIREETAAMLVDPEIGGEILYQLAGAALLSAMVAADASGRPAVDLLDEMKRAVAAATRPEGPDPP